MRIGINALAIKPEYSGGITTYIKGLVSGFSHDKENTYQIYCTKYNIHLFSFCENIDSFDIFCVEPNFRLKRIAVLGSALLGSQVIYEKVSNFLFKRVSGLFEQKSDVLYTPSTILLVHSLAIPQILSMHDIQQFHFPEFFSRLELRAREVSFESSTRNAEFIQASSEFIKRDLLSHYHHLCPENIWVIPEGVDVGAFQSPSNVDVVAKYKLENQFIFFPAQLWPHKNHITVLKALKLIQDNHGLCIPLVLTGRAYGAAREIFDFIKHNKMDYVKYLGVVPFCDLHSLYYQARFMITAVLYESSSLPILEAAAVGTPIIASRTPPNEEVSRFLSLNFFDPLDYNKLADLLYGLWKDELIETQQALLNIKAISNFDWVNIAKAYLNRIEDQCYVAT